MDTIKKYLIDLEIVKNSSPCTVRNYSYCLKNFYNFVRKNITNVKLGDVWAFKLYLVKQGTSQSWADYHLTVVKAFLKWAYCNDLPVINFTKIELGKTEHKEAVFLFRNELENMFHVHEKNKLIDARNQAILHVLYSTGLRVAELHGLDRETVNTISREFRVCGKGKKYRIVFLSFSAVIHLRKYLNMRRDGHAPLFITHGRTGLAKNRRLSVESIERIVKTYAKNAGIHKKVTPHSIRHSFATELLRNGADLTAVKDMLGHSSIQTTQIYLHNTDARLREAHAAFLR